MGIGGEVGLGVVDADKLHFGNFVS